MSPMRWLAGAATIALRRWRSAAGGTIGFLVLALTFRTFAADVQSPLALCWTPAELAFAETEREHHRGVAGAHMKLPNLTLAPAAPAAETLVGSIRRVRISDGRKLVALTFDLCEDGGEISGYDGGVVEYLRNAGIKATFFAGGKWMLHHPERAMQLMGDPLFEIGNHSWSHREVRHLTPEQSLNEMLGAEAAYQQTRSNLAARECLASAPAAMTGVPERMRLFRFPFGACNPETLKLAGEQGYLAIQWDVSMGDPTPGETAKMIAHGVLAEVQPGSIVIGHANGRGVHTAEALPLLIPALQAKGYEFVTVSELLAAGEPEIAAECYDHKPGDVNRYDNLGWSSKSATPAGKTGTKPKAGSDAASGKANGKAKAAATSG